MFAIFEILDTNEEKEQNNLYISLAHGMISRTKANTFTKHQSYSLRISFKEKKHDFVL